MLLKKFLYLQKKTNFVETDDGKECVKKRFTDQLNKNNNKRSSRYTSLGVVFAETLNRTIADHLKKHVSQSRTSNWLKYYLQ